MNTLKSSISSIHAFMNGMNPANTLLLEHGREFKFAKLPEHMKTGEAKNCFENAMDLCYEHPELAYAEGYAMKKSLGVPLDHGWCVDEAGTVYDPTWEGPGEYFGFSIPVHVLNPRTL